MNSSDRVDAVWRRWIEMAFMVYALICPIHFNVADSEARIAMLGLWQKSSVY
jgi:hypothetical protein